MLARPAGLGILLIMLTALVVSGEMVISRVMTELGWPYWYITAVACFLSSGLLAAILLVVRPSPSTRMQLNWVVARGAFGGAYWSLGVVAVQVGASPGDVAALMSINIVVAAFLGRLLLGEHLRLAHAGAVVFSVAGSLLIARPGFLFGVDGQRESSWFGHLCAATAGFTQSCAFICSRKAAEVHVGIHTLSVLLASGLSCCLLAVSGMVPQPSLEVLRSSPLGAASWLAGTFVTSMTGICFASAGGMLCPVAVSATVYTASTMFLGYLSQTLIFGSTPSVLSFAGAGLMLAAVVLMALAQASARKEREIPAPDINGVTAVAAGEEEEVESLASFIASEMSEFEPRSSSVRFRRVFPMSSVAAQRIGAVASMVPAGG